MKRQREIEEIVDIPENLTKDEISMLLKEADALDVVEITTNNLKKQVACFRQLVEKNRESRVKYENDHLEYVKNEVDLDEEIARFGQIAAKPELLEDFMQNGGFSLLIDLLGHPNIDIVNDSLTLLSDLSDPEIYNSIAARNNITDHLVNISIIPIVVSILTKSAATTTTQNQEEEDTEQIETRITALLQISDNLLENNPELKSQFIQTGSFLPTLMDLLSRDETKNYNTIFASELLSQFFQYFPECASDSLGTMKLILKPLAEFKERNFFGALETEHIANLFACLSSLLLHEDHRESFHESHGVQVMLLMIHNRNAVYRSALRTLDYALQSSPRNCMTLVESNGLRSIFGVFMRKGVTTKPHSIEEKEDDDHTLNIIGSLLKHCTGSCYDRLVHKFMENGFQKIERLVDLHQKYAQWLNANTHPITISPKQDITKDDVYLSLCEKGLSSLQSVDNSLVRLCNAGNSTLSEGIIKFVHQKSVSARKIEEVVTDYIEMLDDKETDGRELKQHLDFFLNKMRGV